MNEINTAFGYGFIVGIHASLLAVSVYAWRRCRKMDKEEAKLSSAQRVAKKRQETDATIDKLCDDENNQWAPAWWNFNTVSLTPEQHNAAGQALREEMGGGDAIGEREDAFDPALEANADETLNALNDCSREALQARHKILKAQAAQDVKDLNAR